MKGYIYEKYTEFMNNVRDPLSTSEFIQRGVLTPEEVSKYWFFFINDIFINLVCDCWRFINFKVSYLDLANFKNSTKRTSKRKTILINKKW